MLNKNAKIINTSTSHHHQVYQKAYKRIHLTATQRTVFQRLLGFLLRNDRAFPFSAVTMADLTGLDKRTIFRALNKLESVRLITREGMGKGRRFKRGPILCKIISTGTISNKKEATKKIATATLC